MLQEGNPHRSVDDRWQEGAGGGGRDEDWPQRSLLEPVGIQAEKQKVCAREAGGEGGGRGGDKLRETCQRLYTSSNGGLRDSNPLSFLLRTLGNPDKIFFKTPA